MDSLYDRLEVLRAGWLMFMLTYAATMGGRGIVRYFSPTARVVKRFPQLEH